MPLTPADVRNKQFSTTRLRPGYDEEEVDAFLDEIEAELDRLIQENEELRSKLAEAQRTPSAPAAAQPPEPEATSEPSQPSQPSQPSSAIAPEPEPESAQAQEPSQPLAPAEPVSQPEPEPQAQSSPPAQSVPPLPMTAASLGESGDDSMQSASRMLALAQQTADQAVADARKEADETLGKAQREAEETVGKARRQAEQIMSEARSRAEALERDAQERHRQTMGTLVQQRDELERKVDELRDFERLYRSRLKQYLEDQLRDLESGSTESGPMPATRGGSGESSSLPARDVRNGQPGGTSTGPSNPFGAPEAAQHAGSGFRPDSPPSSR